MLGGLCLSDGIPLHVGLEYVGWSLFVRWFNFTLGLEYVGCSLFVRWYNFTRGI